MQTNLSLQALSDCRENQVILKKLPMDLVARWFRPMQDLRDSTGIFPPFSTFSNFIVREARLACDPITSSNPWCITRQETDKTQFQSSALSTEVKEKKIPRRRTKPNKRRQLIKHIYVCFVNVIIGLCYVLKKKNVSERREFAKTKGLCVIC